MSDIAEHLVMAEDEMPVPIRYWWLKRLALAGVVMVLGLVALRLWWGYEAQRRLDEVIAGYRAAGQMVDAAEFDAVLDAVPDADNAAILYEEAMGKLVSTSTSGVRYDEFNDDRSLFETKPADALALLSLNAEVLSLVREARSRTQIAWSCRLNVSPTSRNRAIFSQQRSLAKFLWFSANYHIRRGEYNESIELIRDLWLFSDAVISHPTVLNFFVGSACQCMAIELLEDVMGILAKNEKLVDEDFKEQIQLFIRMAREDAKYISDVENSFSAERAWNYTWRNTLPYYINIPVLGKIPFSSSIIVFMGRPAAVLDLVRYMSYDTKKGVATRATTWRSALTELQIDNVHRDLLTALSRTMTETQMYSLSQGLERTVQMYFNHLSRRRLVVAGLAIKLVEIDMGRWPVSLDELVPDYLPEVPLDPFGGAGDRLKYIVEDGRVLVYSVASDGVDDNGSELKGDPRTGDRTFYLKGKPEELVNK